MVVDELKPGNNLQRASLDLLQEREREMFAELLIIALTFPLIILCTHDALVIFKSVSWRYYCRILESFKFLCLSLLWKVQRWLYAAHKRCHLRDFEGLGLQNDQHAFG